MDVQITPRLLEGDITTPPSKSMAHRLILAAALAKGNSTIRNVSFSQDIQATLRGMEQLGATWTQPDATTLTITGIGGAHPERFSELPRFDCGESGSTLRFLIPIALAAAGGGVFTGQGRLMQRPQQPYFDLFDQKGISYEQTGDTLTVRGTLTPGDYALPGNVSSQFFTGLLYALPLLNAPSRLWSTTALESASYLDMTTDALAQADVLIQRPTPEEFHITPALYVPFDGAVEGDWSQAAFWYAADALDCLVVPEGLNHHSAQGDMIVVIHYLRMVKPGDVTIDLSDCPDLLPPLAVMAAVREGKTYFVNGARLRLKESDRLSTVCQLLNALGGKAEEGADSLTVTGVSTLSGGIVDGCNDHRIVMAAAVAAAACRQPVTIRGAQAVNKSYPNFFDHYTKLGGAVRVL